MLIQSLHLKDFLSFQDVGETVIIGRGTGIWKTKELK